MKLVTLPWQYSRLAWHTGVDFMVWQHHSVHLTTRDTLHSNTDSDETLGHPSVSSRDMWRRLSWCPDKCGCPSHLHSLQVVAVVAEDSGQFDASDLRQLLEGEGWRPAAVLIPEPVSVSEVVELFADETGQGGADHTARQRPLRDAGRPQVDIFWRGVHFAESLNREMMLVLVSVIMAACWWLLARVWLHRVLSHLHTVVGHVKTQIVPSSDGAQATELTPPDDKKLIRYSSLIGPKVLFIVHTCCSRGCRVLYLAAYSGRRDPSRISCLNCTNLYFWHWPCDLRYYYQVLGRDDW